MLVLGVQLASLFVQLLVLGVQLASLFVQLPVLGVQLASLFVQLPVLLAKLAVVLLDSRIPGTRARVLQPQGQVAILLQERRGRQTPGRVQDGAEPPAVQIRREGGIDAVPQAEAFQPRSRGGPAGFRIVNPVFLDAAGLVKRHLVLHRLLVVGMRDVAPPRGGGQDFQHQVRHLVPRHDVRAGTRRLAGRVAQVEEHVGHDREPGAQIEVHLPLNAEIFPPARAQMAANDGDRLRGDIAVNGTGRHRGASAGVLLFGLFAGRQGTRARPRQSLAYFRPLDHLGQHHRGHLLRRHGGSFKPVPP